MASALGGEVRRGEKGEYGLAALELDDSPDPLFAGLSGCQQVWMSHRDVVAAAPPGFSVIGRTPTCAIAAMADPERAMYGLQFHPEVVHTTRGREYLSNFTFRVCGCTEDWDPRHRVPILEREIREAVGSRNVFFFVSGGVDSSVAFALCMRALGPDRVRGVYVDTGLMRQGETDWVSRIPGLTVEHAEDRFLGALAGVTDPERKRHIIGEEFVRVQKRIVESRSLLDEHWILGQGTIYPDTIESGGTAKASLIKTHHNRVAGIQELIAAGRIVEPLKSFYKDEVREVGAELGLPAELLERHPFPGPGLAIRCLCSPVDAPVRQTPEGWLVPVKSVGVQGDERSYAPVMAIDSADGSLDYGRAIEIVNQVRDVNRVVALIETRVPVERGLAVSGHPDSARHRRSSGFYRSAPHRFGGRHDRALGAHGCRPSKRRVRRRAGGSRHRRRLLRPHPQTPGHYRVGVTRGAADRSRGPAL